MGNSSVVRLIILMVSLVVSAATFAVQKNDLGVARQKPIKFNLHKGHAKSAKAVSQIDIESFDGGSITLEVTQVEVRNEQNFTWKGKVHGMADGSHAILTVVNGQIAGQIVTVDHRGWGSAITYQVQSKSDGSIQLQQIDQKAFPHDHPSEGRISKHAPQSSNDSLSGAATGASATSFAADSGATIDVMVVYTNQVAAAGGSIDAEIQQAVDVSNSVYANTGIATRLRLVHTEQINYNESGDVTADLNALSGNSTVANLRNTYGADMVIEFSQGGGGYCGMGWIGPSANYAFTVVTRSCASGNLSFPHELGHNFGALHDTFVDSGNSPYAYGHGMVNCNEGWRTVMAYPSQCGGTRIPYFSNPNKTYGSYGSLLGTTSTNDVARVINNNAYAVANYRTAVSGCTYSLSPSSASVGGLTGSGSFAVTAIGTACAWGASSNASWLSIGASSGTSGNGTLYYSFLDNYGAARSAMISIGNQSFSINQASACSYSLSAASASFTASGGGGSVTLTASNAACTWQASSGASWLTLTSAASGSGSATVNYSVVANSSAARSANLNIAGQVHTVSQSASLLPIAGLSSSSLSFGTVVLGKVSSAMTATLKNNGGGPLKISAMAMGGANPSEFTRSGTCAINGTLASGQSCTMIVTFKPTVIGSRSAKVQVSTDGGAVTLSLSGSGKKTGKR